MSQILRRPWVSSIEYKVQVFYINLIPVGREGMLSNLAPLLFYYFNSHKSEANVYRWLDNSFMPIIHKKKHWRCQYLKHKFHTRFLQSQLPYHAYSGNFALHIDHNKTLDFAVCFRVYWLLRYPLWLFESFQNTLNVFIHYQSKSICISK